MVCDADGHVMFLHIGYPGSVHDGRVYTETLCPLIRSGACPIFPGYYMVFDNAFARSDYNQTTGRVRVDEDEAEASLRNALSSPRMSSEHVFGQIASKWRYFRSNLEAKSISKVVQIIEFAFRMHNLIKEFESSHSNGHFVDVQAAAFLPPDGHEDHVDNLQAQPDVQFIQHAALAGAPRQLLSDQTELEQGNAVRADLKEFVSTYFSLQ